MRLDFSCRVRKRANNVADAWEGSLGRLGADLAQVHRGQAADTSTIQSARGHMKCSHRGEVLDSKSKCGAGAERGWLPPPVPYGCASVRFIKRSRSDIGEVSVRPVLRALMGSRYYLLS